MRPRLFLLTALLLQLSPPSHAQETRGIGVVAYDPVSGEDIQLYRESWALVVGINKYRFVTPLDYAVADAEAIRNLLIEKFGFKPERIIELLDDKATKSSITQAFSDLLQTDQQDRVVVFYAGHGTQYTTPGGGETGYLVPVDGKVETAADLYNTCVSMQEVRNLSGLIPAKHILFLVDACYGGLAAVTSRALSRETQQYLKKISLSNARQIITAGGKGEQVIEKAEWGHSAFTFKLLEGLGKGLADVTGDYLVTASELFTYLKPAVSAAAENRQTPVFKAFTEDEGEFVFVLGMPKYTVSFNSLPPSALVIVDNKQAGLTPLTLELERGKYMVEIFKSGYQSHKQELDVKGNMTVSPQLVEDVYELAIASNPSGGQVFINGVERGSTALVVKMKPGKYTVLIEKSGYHPWTQEIEINSNQSVTATLTPAAEQPPLVQKPEDVKPELKKEQPAKEKPPTKPEERKVTKGKGSKTLLYVLGGVAVAGGAAAVLLLGGGGGGEGGPAPPTTLPGPPDLP